MVLLYNTNQHLSRGLSPAQNVRYMSLKMTLHFGNHFCCCAATCRKHSSGRHKYSSRKPVNAAPKSITRIWKLYVNIGMPTYERWITVAKSDHFCHSISFLFHFHFRSISIPFPFPFPSFSQITYRLQIHICIRNHL